MKLSIHLPLVYSCLTLLSFSLFGIDLEWCFIFFISCQRRCCSCSPTFVLLVFCVFPTLLPLFARVLFSCASVFLFSGHIVIFTRPPLHSVLFCLFYSVRFCSGFNSSMSLVSCSLNAHVSSFGLVLVFVLLQMYCVFPALLVLFVASCAVKEKRNKWT